MSMNQNNTESGGALRELLGFLNRNKKWWLGPLLLALFLVGALIFINGDSFTPFVYSPF